MTEPTQDPKDASIKPKYEVPDSVNNLPENMREEVALQYQVLMAEYFSRENRRRSSDDSEFYNVDNPIFRKLILDRAKDVVRLSREGGEDKLTGLNRLDPFKNSFELKMSELNTNPDLDSNLVFVSFDLSRFKIINDTLGHDMGDRVLNAVGQKLKGRMRSQDVACRAGGDEFMLILNGVPAESVKEVVKNYHDIVTNISLAEIIARDKFRAQLEAGEDVEDELEEEIKAQEERIIKEMGPEFVKVRSNFGALALRRGANSYFEDVREKSDLLMYQVREMASDVRNGYGMAVLGEEKKLEKGFLIGTKKDGEYATVKVDEIPKPTLETRKNEIKGSLQRTLEQMSRAITYGCFSREEYDEVESKLGEVGASYHKASQCIDSWESKQKK